jgi:hypothetical protein
MARIAAASDFSVYSREGSTSIVGFAGLQSMVPRTKVHTSATVKQPKISRAGCPPCSLRCAEHRPEQLGHGVGAAEPAPGLDDDEAGQLHLLGKAPRQRPVDLAADLHLAEGACEGHLRPGTDVIALGEGEQRGTGATRCVGGAPGWQEAA